MQLVTPSLTFRADIQGLRALAVGLVFIYHLWPGVLNGGYIGVDVFFVVSGFLITNVLKREVLSTGHLNLAGFYIRRARRLLPAASLVIICAGLLTIVFFPSTRWDNLTGEMSASALYFQNFFLYFQSVDYLTQDSPPSLLRHYWSLSVEEQFYFLWPLLMLIASKWIVKWRWSGATTLFFICSFVFASSLYFSITSTPVNPSAGYFLPQNRLFELALGGMLSIAYPSLRIEDKSNWLLGWLGVLAIVVSAMIFNHETVFPGFTALLPTLGTVLVVVSGKRKQAFAVAGVLGLRPLRYIGDISYSLYLWHWPLILTYQQIYGEEISFAHGFLVIAASVICAHFTKFYIEDRWRQGKRDKKNWSALARFATPSIVVVLGFSFVIQISISRPFESVKPYEFDKLHPGAMTFLQDEQFEVDELIAFIPSVETARRDNPDLYADGCHVSQTSEEPTPCRYGPVDAQRVIVLAGDSHAAHWLPALRALSERNGYAVVTHTKSSCAFIQLLLARGKNAYENCQAWNVKAMQEIIELKPDLVVTGKISSTRAAGIQIPEINRETVVEAMAETWKMLGDAGIPVLAIEQTPRFGFEMPECLASTSNGLQECTRTRNEVLDRYDPTPEAAKRVKTAMSANLNDWICLETDCPPVIGNVLVYRDQHHLTATYSRSLSFALEEQIMLALNNQNLKSRHQ